jgi:hypothetical protein
MNVSPTPVDLGDAESQTAIYLRASMGSAPGDVDVRTDLSTWDGTTAVLHVHRVGGSRDRFIDRARIAIDAHGEDRDTAFALANEARGLLQAWPATAGLCRGSSEELGPTSLPVEAELPTVAMTWAVSI